jgi:hypothetical protein
MPSSFVHPYRTVLQYVRQALFWHTLPTVYNEKFKKVRKYSILLFKFLSPFRFLLV